MGRLQIKLLLYLIQLDQEWREAKAGEREYYPDMQYAEVGGVYLQHKLSVAESLDRLGLVDVMGFGSEGSQTQVRLRDLTEQDKY